MGKRGILLVNLGTPDSPSTPDVRKYLSEFLMDGKVIDIHPIWRTLLVKGIIVPFRGPKSAKIYQKIWNSESGSPLLYFSKIQQALLQQHLGSDYQVELAMRYQNPSIESGLNKLREANVDSIKVIPLFPQYASASTGSVHDKVMELVRQWTTIPDITFVNSFHDNEMLIAAFADNARKYEPQNYDHVLFSFHGLPKRHLIKSDISQNHCIKAAECCKNFTDKNKFCYSAQCYHTAKLIADKSGINLNKYTVSFQSRLGNDPWIKPYTSDVIKELAMHGKKKLLVFSPAFVADCLETIYEIQIEARDEFLKSGGEELQLVESLNDSPKWISALAALAA